MRTMILLCSCVFLVIVSVCYSFAWYLQSRDMRSAFEEKLKALGEKQTYLTYDAIETSGFPMDVNVVLVNPRFKGNVAEFLRTNAGEPYANLPAWQEDMALQGTISIGLNLTGNRYDMTISGNWQNTSDIGGKQYRIATANAGDTHCSVEFANRMGIFDTLWDFEAITKRDGEQLLSDFRLLDCHTPGYRTTDQQNGQELMSSGPVRLFASSEEATEGRRQIRSYVKIDNSAVTPAGDAVIFAYVSHLFPGTPAPEKLSAYGSKQIEMDASYLGPVRFDEDGIGSTPMELHLNTLTLSNLAYTLQGNLHFSNGATTQERNTTLRFTFDSTHEQAYDQLMHDMVRNVILQLYSPFVAQPADIQPLIRKYNADQLYAIVQPAIPSLHSLGKLNQSVDFSFKGSPDLSTGEFTFNNLNLSATPYGLNGRGTIRLAEGQLLPAANILLACANCPRMIDDMADYATRAERAAGTLSDSPQTGWMASYNPQGLKDFLAALAQPAGDAPNRNDYNYSIISDGVSGITINGKKLDELMALYSQTLAPSPARLQDPLPGIMLMPEPQSAPIQ